MSYRVLNSTLWLPTLASRILPHGRTQEGGGGGGGGGGSMSSNDPPPLP